MNKILILIAGTCFSLSLYSQDLLVRLESSAKHRAWAEKPAELCEVLIKNGTPPKGALFVACDTAVSKVRFLEPGIIDINVEIEPVKVGFTPIEEQRASHAVYIAARAKITEMENSNKKFKKELEEELTVIFDEKALFLSDVMYILLPAETEFTLYRPETGAVKGTLEQLANN